MASPAHPVGRAATIAGSLVEPIRPLAPRAVYNHVGRTTSGRSTLGAAGSGAGGRSGYNPWANSPGTQRSRAWTVPATGRGYAPPAGGTNRAPAASPYSGGAYRAPSGSPYSGSGGTYRPQNASPSSGGSRPAPAPTPQPSEKKTAPRAGGGGGGGSHVSAGPHK